MNNFNTSLIAESSEFYQTSPDIKECLERNELGDAELFAFLFRGKVLFDHAEGQWYFWRGKVWGADKTQEVFQLIAFNVASKYFDWAKEERVSGNDELSKKGFERARQLRGKRRVENVQAIASTLLGIALKGNEWDAPMMQLRVANGIIDLETGEFREGQPGDYVRSCCPVEWHGIDAPCPTWEKTFREIFNKDEDLINFVRRLFGYAITGSIKEQVLPILWGDGANGKSTLMDTIATVLGNEICHGTQTEALMDSRRDSGESAKPFLTALRGSRLVWASESREGQTLNVGLIKQLTGDQTITARGLYQNPMTFPNTAKIMLITNHSPQIKGGDDYALWRRILRIPFTQRFIENPQNPNEQKADKDLLVKLRNEYPGIVAWLVRGCLEWQAQGLNPPKVVIESVAEYRQDEDLIEKFIKECLIVSPGHKSASSALYKEYKQWCMDCGFDPIHGREFANQMAKRFGRADHTRNGQIYNGVGLKADQP